MLNRVLTDEELRLMAFFEKINRLVSGFDSLTVEDTKKSENWEIQGTAYGCCITEKKEIFLNISRLLSRGLMTAFGVNYHELSHVLYTPKNSESFNTSADAVYTSLEEGRIESLFSSKYRKAAKYFTFAVLKSIKPCSESFLMLYSRRAYLPSNIVNTAKQLFMADRPEFTAANIKQICSLVDDFVIEEELTKREDIAYKIAMLLSSKLPPNKPIEDFTERTQHPLKNIKGGEQPEGKVKKNIKDGVQKAKERLEEKDKDNSTAEEDSKGTIEDIKEQLKKEIAKAKHEAQDAAEQEIKEVKDSISDKRGGEGYSEKGTTKISSTPFVFEQKVFIESKKLEEQLRRIRADVSDGLTRNQLNGKLDLKAAMDSKRVIRSDIFANQQLNKINQTKMAVAVLIDESGSVGGEEYKEQVNAAKAICEALEHTGSKVSVYAFSDRFHLKKSFYGAFSGERDLSGGTNPYHVLTDAHEKLKRVKRSFNIQNSLIILITDGGYFEDNKFSFLKNHHEMLEILVGVGNTYGHTQIFNNTIHINNFDELNSKMTGFIERLQKRLVEKIKSGF